MFTWICPQCGREVPPSYSECPTCAERRQQASQPPTPAPPPAAPLQQPPPQPQYQPQQPQYQPAPQQPVQPQYSQPQYPPQQPVYAPPPPPQQAAPPPPPVYQQPAQQYAPAPAQPMYTITEQKKGMPTWMVAVLTLVVLGGGLFGLYKLIGGKSTSTTAKEGTKLEQPGASAASGTHPYAKYVEVAGLRIVETPDKKVVLRYTVVNHSPGELTGLELNIALTPKDSAAGADPISVISAKVGDIPANGIKDMESPMKTTMKVYELPDWQFLKASFDITAPK